MASVKDRAAGAVATLRRKRPLVDHLVRMQGHYGSTKAGQQAGAVTYFGFLSVFPILALAVFAVGYLSQVVPEARDTLVDAVSGVLPGLIGEGEGQISLDSMQSFTGLAGVVGVLGVLYSGLGWLSALRDALVTVFETPAGDQPGFVKGKLRDLLTLAVIGAVLLLSVAVTGVVSTGSSAVLDLVGVGSQFEWLVKVLSVVLGLLANTVLFFAMFQLLATPHAPRRSVWQGALLGAVGFEVLKQASSYLIASTKGQPAFQAFGIALILLVWINYFTRVVLYSASFAQTAPEARRLREEEALESDSAVSTPASVLAAASASVAAPEAPGAADATYAGKEPRRRSGWMDDFVDRIDQAAPADVGEASAEASRLADAEHRRGVRNRLVAGGAAVGAAGMAVAAVLRRSRR